MAHYYCILCGIKFDIEGSNVSEHRESNGHQVLHSLFDACIQTKLTKQNAPKRKKCVKKPTTPMRHCRECKWFIKQEIDEDECCKYCGCFNDYKPYGFF